MAPINNKINEMPCVAQAFQAVRQALLNSKSRSEKDSGRHSKSFAEASDVVASHLTHPDFTRDTVLSTPNSAF